MDVISFSEAATANSRIEIINANPDSTSGIVTVPKVIANGETVTIPAGRVAVLPNVQIDGVLNVNGEVFIPSGATFGDLETQLTLKAPLSSPAFTGTPIAPTQTAQDNSTKLATTAYVDGKMVLGASVATKSGTSIDFTGIPSWVKRITVMFNGVSTNGSSPVQIQLGDSGGIETSGYNIASTYIKGGAGITGATYSTGFGIYQLNPNSNRYGSIIFNLMSGNTWEAIGLVYDSSDSSNSTVVGGKTLSAILDRIRLTTVNGTDTFDAGQINIMYEG